MSGIFQHLKPQSSASPGVDEQKAFARVLDLHRSVLDQSGGHDLIQANDGVVIQVPVSLPRPAAESDRYDRNNPSTLIVAQGLSEEHLAAKTRALLNSIEGQEAGMPNVNLDVTMETGRKTLQSVALVAGLGLKPMQVGHLDGSRWRVGGGGKVTWARGQKDIPGTDLTLSQGWIVIPIKITPEQDSSGYDLEVGDFQAMSRITNAPPARSFTLSEDELSTQQSWTPGTYHIPVAYVTAPGQGEYLTPFILQGVGDENVQFFGTSYGPGIPIIG